MLLAIFALVRCWIFRDAVIRFLAIIAVYSVLLIVVPIAIYTVIVNCQMILDILGA